MQVNKDGVARHGYAAHARRRTSTGTGAGISLEDVRQNLLRTVPGLEETGMSLTAVAYLFCPLPMYEKQVNDTKVL